MNAWELAMERRIFPPGVSEVQEQLSKSSSQEKSPTHCNLQLGCVTPHEKAMTGPRLSVDRLSKRLLKGGDTGHLPL